MSRSWKLTLGALAFVIFVGADPGAIILEQSWTATAAARVGRPATPASVAGVARRTTRRCAADVYDC